MKTQQQQASKSGKKRNLDDDLKKTLKERNDDFV